MKRLAGLVLALVLLSLVAGCDSAAPASVPAPTALPDAPAMPPASTITSIPSTALSPSTASPEPTALPSPTTVPEPTAMPEPEVTASSIYAPQGSAATIDGVLTPGEWDDALSIELASGELLLMHAGGYLYVGISSDRLGLGSVCLLRDDEISILHASAALGTATYERAGDAWQKTRDFLWTNRETSDNPQALAARREHLERENWLASIEPMGNDHEMEYQIALTDDRAVLAVTYLMSPRYSATDFWPETLAAGCRTFEPLRSEAPESVPFEPESWVTVIASLEDGLTEAEAATLATLQRVHDHPLYTMHYVGPYNQRQVSAAAGQTPATASEPAWACALFAALGDTENMFYGRNFDWRDSPALLLFTDPPDGFASVSMVDIEYLVGLEKADTLTELPLVERSALLDAPLWPFDGMNEQGLAIGMAAVPAGNVPPDPDKETIDSLLVMRRVLDQARDVDEAVAILQGYNIEWGGGPDLHYLVADRAGHSMLVEFYQGEIVLIPNPASEPWHQATNFLRASAGDSPAGECPRYDHVSGQLVESNGRLTLSGAMELLSQVAQENTQWSIVYGLSAGDVTVSMGRDFAVQHTFRLDLAGGE